MKNTLFRRVTAAFLAAVMTIACAGCNSASQVDPDSGSASAEEVQPESAASARVTIDGTKFMVDGKELWINGVNTPWQHWNDFWGGMDEAFWDKTFAQLAEDNINCTRIWLNCNGEHIVQLNDDGKIVGVNEGHWTDLDKLFDIAEKHGVYIMATLLSFDHFKEPKNSASKWRALISSKEYSDMYAEKYVAEFCKRYGDREYLFSIDIMNEPDWVHENAECGQIGWEHLSYFFGKCAATIHENCDTLVTVGMGMVKYNSDKYNGNMISDKYLKELTGLDGAYVDFYSPHHYGWQTPHFGLPNSVTPEEFGLDAAKPSLIGECSNDDEAECGMDLTAKYKATHDNGWCGIMVWMQPAEGEYDWYRYDLTETATNAMAEYIPEKIYPIGKKAPVQEQAAA